MLLAVSKLAFWFFMLFVPEPGIVASVPKEMLVPLTVPTAPLLPPPPPKAQTVLLTEESNTADIEVAWTEFIVTTLPKEILVLLTVPTIAFG